MKTPTWLTRLLCRHDWGTSAELRENGMPDSFSLYICMRETGEPDKPSVERTVRSYTMKLRCVKCGRTKDKQLACIGTKQLYECVDRKLKDIARMVIGKKCPGGSGSEKDDSAS